MTSAKVIVCVPTFNKAELLKQSVGSILNQTFSNFKLIIVDDHSSDDTKQVVASFGDPRIRYCVNPRNLGLTANWNRCVELALGEPASYVAVYHDDDHYAPTILEREVAFLERHLHVGFVHTAQLYYNEDQDHYAVRMPYTGDKIISEIDLLDDVCFRGIYHIATPSVLARKDAYVKAGGFDPTFKICPDLDLWWRMLEHYDMGYIAEPLLTQRIHRKQMSSSAEALNNALTQKETGLVLGRALRRLCERYKNLDVERYTRHVQAFCALRILKAARDALLEADHSAVSKACAEAVRTSPRMNIYVGAIALRLLNNGVGRFTVSAIVRCFRYLRRGRRPASPSGIK